MSPQTKTSDDILRCARQLVAAGGYNGFSYADIADVVGIRKASIHHHFPAKADLVRILVAQYREEAEAALMGIGDHHASPVEQLRAYTGFWAGCIADGTLTFCVCALLATELPVLPPEVALEVRAYFRMLSDWLTSVMEQGQSLGMLVPGGDCRTEAESFMATVHGAMLSARAYGDAALFSTIIDPLIARLTKA